MKLVFLGTASSKPSSDRNVSSIAIHHNREILLFDCGEGTQRQMLHLVKQSRISKIFISHFHGDHYLGLPGLLMTMSLNNRSAPVDIYGPPGASTFIDNLLHSGYMDIGFEVRVTEVYDKKIAGEGYCVIPFPVDHGIPALGYVFVENDRRGSFNVSKAMALGIREEMFSYIDRTGSMVVDGSLVTLQEVTGPPKKGIKIVYSGDTRPVKFPDEAKAPDILIHEATFISIEEKGDTYHSTVLEACQTAKDIGAAQLVLTHLNSRYEHEELEQAAQLYFDNVCIAKDFLTIEL